MADYLSREGVMKGAIKQHYGKMQDAVFWELDPYQRIKVGVSQPLLL